MFQFHDQPSVWEARKSLCFRRNGNDTRTSGSTQVVSPFNWLVKIDLLCQHRPDRIVDEESYLWCVFPTLRYKHVVVVLTGMVFCLVEESYQFLTDNVHHSMLFSFNWINTTVELTIVVVSSQFLLFLLLLRFEVSFPTDERFYPGVGRGSPEKNSGCQDVTVPPPKLVVSRQLTRPLSIVTSFSVLYLRSFLTDPLFTSQHKEFVISFLSLQIGLCLSPIYFHTTPPMYDLKPFSTQDQVWCGHLIK